MIVASRNSDQFNLRFPTGIRERLKAIAAQNGRSLNSEIVYALLAYLTAAEGAKFGDRTPTAALSNNAALQGGASITNG